LREIADHAPRSVLEPWADERSATTSPSPQARDHIRQGGGNLIDLRGKVDLERYDAR
jgi:hypothetical protein